MPFSWTILLASGFDANQVQLQTDKIAEIARVAGLSVHPLTAANSKEDLRGVSFDGDHGRVSGW